MHAIGISRKPRTHPQAVERWKCVNYWERWIGAWKKKTAHLSVEERGAYGEILDWCYANEQAGIPQTEGEVYRIVGAHTTQERKSVDRVVKLFWPDGAEHPRVAEEIAKRRAYVEKQRELAVRRWQGHEQQEPKPKRVNGADLEPIPEWVPGELWASWWSIRPSKARTQRAQDLALKELQRLRTIGHTPQAVLENCIRGGYRGIFAPGGKPAIRKRDDIAAV
jgi:uncharacterized protein YdaU (DUF1376 family)